MYLILQVENKIFKPYSDKSRAFLLNYDGTISENNIIKWLHEKYRFLTSKINIDSTHSSFIFTSTIHKNEFFDGKLVSFSTAIKHLTHAEDDEIKEYLLNKKIQADIKLQYGLRGNKLISINDISQEQKGLKCNCFCPGCGKKLQAKIGRGKRQPHFAHNNEACNISVAHQSALHILAKEIIQEEHKIGLPSLKVKFEDLHKDNIKSTLFELPEELIYKTARTVKCSQVTLEKKISNIVPDIMVKIGEKYCLIEIAVTHFVDEEKKKKIEKIGLPVIEIDLSMLSGSELSKDSVKKILMEENDLKYWIYNPKTEEARCWAISEYGKRDKEIVSIQEKREQAEREKNERKEQKRKIAEKKIEQLQNGENYEKAVKQLRNDVMFIKTWERRTFYKETKEIPFYMDIPIAGEVVFDCDRRIWQSAIFDKFIYNRKPNAEHILYVESIIKWAISYQNEFRINWDLTYATSITLKDSCYKRSLLRVCIKEYLYYLSLLGFISKYFYYYKVLSTHSLISPNREMGANLKNIISHVNQYSWNVTDEIYDLINSNEEFYGQNYTCEIASDFLIDSIRDLNIEKKEKQDKLKQSEYELGLQEVLYDDGFKSDEIIRDSFGYRWLVCTSCGEIKRENEMIDYKGNEGLCRDCNLNIKKRSAN